MSHMWIVLWCFVGRTGGGACPVSACAVWCKKRVRTPNKEQSTVITFSFTEGIPPSTLTSYIISDIDTTYYAQISHQSSQIPSSCLPRGPHANEQRHMPTRTLSLTQAGKECHILHTHTHARIRHTSGAQTAPHPINQQRRRSVRGAKAPLSARPADRLRAPEAPRPADFLQAALPLKQRCPAWCVGGSHHSRRSPPSASSVDRRCRRPGTRRHS